MPRPLASRLRAIPLRWKVGAVAVVALAVSALFGGMAPAHAVGPATTATGTLIAGSPWDVTIVDARVLASQTGLHVSRPGDRWFAVVATVNVTANDASNDMADIIRVHGVSGLNSVKPDEILLTRDATMVDWLNPGMPERLAFCWEQAGSAPIPTSAEVDIYNETYRADSLSGDKAWLDPAVVATVHAAVVDKRS